MGYELRLYVGEPGHSSKEFKRSDVGEIDGKGEGAYVYFPPLKDESGKTVYTGRTAIYFQVWAMIDLGKPGSAAHISALDWRNKESASVYWYHYGQSGGNRQTITDSYGEYSRPVPIGEVIAAIEKDAAADKYRRYHWALAMLKAFPPEAKVMFYGY